MPFSPGYYITAELKVKNESQTQAAKEALLNLCKATLTEPECTLFALHQDPKSPTRFLLWERFDDESAFKTHFEAPHTKEYVAKDLTEVVQYFQTNIAQ
jgi:4-carboxymuconolactone decarboxylase